ncbi:MAG TPA: restriction endonuclease subunit S, partial [Anaerolineales bacterium]
SAIGPRDQFQVAANGITRFGLSGGAIGASLFAIPPVKEQRTIATFLDCETHKIDTLIAKEEKLIELLQEKRTALITRAVSRGLDPSVPTKESGVDWVGEIPTHWAVCFLDKLVDPMRRITYGIVQPGEPDPEGILMVRGQNYSQGWSDPADIFRVSAEVEAPYKRARLRGGDIVMTIVGAGTGNVAIVPAQFDGANITQTTARIAIQRRKGTNRYFAYQLESRMGQANVDVAVKGAAQPGLNLAHIEKFRVLRPPLNEQEAIADYLDRVTRSTDVLASRVRDSIDLLKGYRIALISAAVTGKIDVRGEVS